jgi:hypothetical protein
MLTPFKQKVVGSCVSPPGSPNTAALAHFGVAVSFMQGSGALAQVLMEQWNSHTSFHRPQPMDDDDAIESDDGPAPSASTVSQATTPRHGAAAARSKRAAAQKRPRIDTGDDDDPGARVYDDRSSKFDKAIA